MPTTLCTAVTRSGRPCRSAARAASRFCPFHDPACVPALATGRRKGGSRPYRRPTPPPTAADGALLLYRLFQSALETPGTLDADRLRALARLAPLMLAALNHPTRPTSPSAPVRGTPRAAGA
jgi:hypothetical protein